MLNVTIFNASAAIMRFPVPKAAVRQQF